jgi:hypothetical protein
MSTSVSSPPAPYPSEFEATIAAADSPSERDPAVPWRVARLVLEAAARSVSAVDGALSRAPAGQVAVDVMIGAGAVATEVAGGVVGRLAVAGRRIGARVPRPLLGVERLSPLRTLSRLAERGRHERAAAVVDLERLAAALVPAVTAAVLDRLDLTALVRDRVALDTLVSEVNVDAVAARVDIDAITARVDVDTIAGRVDVDAIVDRLDLVALANRVIDGIDLPEIIRESTGSVTGDMVRDVRMRGIEADEAVAGLAGRLLRRRPRPPTVDTVVPGMGTPT